MQAFISIVERKTNLEVSSGMIDLTNIEDLDISSESIFNLIWEESKKNAVLGARNNYIIQLYNQRNHSIHLHESDGITCITDYDKFGSNVICLQDYRYHKLRKYAG